MNGLVSRLSARFRRLLALAAGLFAVPVVLALCLAASGCGRGGPGAGTGTAPGTGGTRDPAVPSDTAEADPVTLPEGRTGTDDPSRRPGNPELYRGVVIHSVYGTGGNGTDAVMARGYVQLRNTTDRTVSLKGASLYYKTDDAAPYAQLVFPDDASIPPSGYYLVCANAAAGFSEANAVMRLDHYDLLWDVTLDNKEIRLVLAPSGWLLDRDEDIARLDGAVSLFLASDRRTSAACAVQDLSRYKVAVRSSPAADSGFHTVNLTRSTTADLRRLRTRTSHGALNEVAASRLDEVLFSQEAGVYDQPFLLTLSAAPGRAVYYTTDGSDPALHGKRYVSPLRMDGTSACPWGPVTRAWADGNGRAAPLADRLPGAHVVKAYATDGTTSTPVYTNTYFVCPQLRSCGVSVMSFSLPAERMIGPEGFYSNYCPTGQITDPRPRGVGILEVFDREGRRVGCSRVEAAVGGNGSTGWGMKSLRVYYKGRMNQDAGLQSELQYDLFDGRARNANGRAITSFSRLLLRNSGNDCCGSYVRDAFMQRASAGLRVDTMASAPVLLFVNGEFFGVYNARERYSQEYVESHYGVCKDAVALIESDYSQVHTNVNAPYVVGKGEEGDADPFNELVAYMLSHDLADPEAFAYVSERMDLASFTDMWVSRLFFSARDFPENNIKVWRNKDPDDPSGMDTRWRFTLLDMDFGLSFFTDSSNTTENSNYFPAFIGSNSVCGHMMQALLGNPGFREDLIARLYEAFTETFTPERLSATFEEMAAERLPLLQLQEDRWGHDGASVARQQREFELIRAFLAGRQPHALEFLYGYFGVSEGQIREMGRRTVTVVYGASRCAVTVNGAAVPSGRAIPLGEGAEPVPLLVRAEAKPGYVVTGMTFVGRDGRTQRSSKTEETFLASGTGEILIRAARDSAEPPGPGGSVTAGATYAFYLTPEGDLYAWGDNRFGMLGLDGAPIVPTPQFVADNVAKVATTCAADCENGSVCFMTAVLKRDGSLYTAGDNTRGQLGRDSAGGGPCLGRVPFDGRIADVSVGFDHLLVLDECGALWGVGSNARGALGPAHVGQDVRSFQLVAQQVLSASAGRRSTLYIADDGRGTLYGLGDNRWGKMSAEAGETIASPLPLLRGAVRLSSGEHQATVVDGDGTLFYCGWREFGSFQQGGGNRPALRRVMGGVRKASVYCEDLVIVGEDDVAYVYGLNRSGAIGSSAVTGGAPRAFLENVSDAAAGFGFTVYLTRDGALLTQGDNTYGQAGDGTIGGRADLCRAAP